MGYVGRIGMDDKYGYLTGVPAMQARGRHQIPRLWALPMPQLPASPDASSASGPLESNSAFYLLSFLLKFMNLAPLSTLLPFGCCGRSGRRTQAASGWELEVQAATVMTQ
jgi:hypothetical protein